MRWLKSLLAILVALLMLAMVAIYLTPLDAYVPEAEQVLGAQLREPVRIGHLRLAALPLPHLELEDVQVGGQEGIVARSIVVALDLPALIAGRVVVRRIALKNGVAHLVQVRRLLDLFTSVPLIPQGVPVRELQLSGMTVLAQEAALGAVEGRLEFADAGRLRLAWFALDGQKMAVTLLPQPDRRFGVVMEAQEWVTPQFRQFPPLRLGDLRVVGTLGERDFTVQGFSVASQGIRAAGSGKLEWSDGWRVQATLKRLDARLEQVMALLEKPVELTGALSVKGELSGTAGDLSGLSSNLQFSGEALVSQGTARIAANYRRPLAFDRIRARVMVRPGRLELKALDARLYGGKLTGEMSLDRRNGMLAAEAAAEGIVMHTLVEALTNEILFTGSMDGAAKFSMRLDEIERFPENLRLTANFRLRDGALTRVDLVQAASNPGRTYARGGVTRFDDLSGLLSVDATGYHLRKLKMTSGSLNAGGNIDVSHSLQLKGTLDADIRGTAGLVSMPLSVSGTLADPVILPSGSVLAGAAVGTAILGPGLGTAVGIRIGGFLNRLFGRNDGANSNKDAAKKPSATK